MIEDIFLLLADDAKKALEEAQRHACDLVNPAQEDALRRTDFEPRPQGGVLAVLIPGESDVARLCDIA